MQHALTRAAPRAFGARDEYDILALDDKPKVDDSYWVQWCASRRSAKFLERLADAQAAADTLIAADREERLSALITTVGVATAKCQWRCCEHFALDGGGQSYCDH